MLGTRGKRDVPTQQSAAGIWSMNEAYEARLDDIWPPDFPTISPVTNGLITLYDFGNTSSYNGSGSTIYDISGQGSHGTIGSNVTVAGTGPAYYASFPGGSTVSTITGGSSLAIRDFTILLKPDTTASNQAGIAGILATDNSSDKSCRFGSVDGVDGWDISGRNPGDANDWASVSATTYYIDGVASTTLNSGWHVFGGAKTSTNAAFNSFQAHIGSSGYPDRYYPGYMAVILLYNRVLSSSEQLQNYNTLSKRIPYLP